MLKRVEGIILRTVKYSESSLICDVFTQEFGLRTYMLNGVRRKRARYGPALIRPMGLVEMVVYHREDKDINKVKEVQASYLYQKVPFDVIRGALGLFITEIAQKSIKEEVANPDLYEFLNSSYQLLDVMEDKLANFHLAFMVQLTRYLGFMPDGSRQHEIEESCFFDYKEGVFLKESPGHIYYFSEYYSKLLLQLLRCEMGDSGSILLNGKTRHQFIEQMIRFYQYHVEHFRLHSHDILHQVLGS